jgi:hypothetical protein
MTTVQYALTNNHRLQQGKRFDWSFMVPETSRKLCDHFWGFKQLFHG